jgi:hypothetical protein
VRVDRVPGGRTPGWDPLTRMARPVRIAILNWSGGENDPFSYFSGNLQRRLQELGHDAIILALDAGFATALHTAHEASPVHLAFAWQGIGSEVRRTGDTATLWERLGIPVVCHHGDHPCYNPPNHAQSSPNLIHLYACASFAKAANLLIRGPFPGLVDPIPNFLDPVPPPAVFGDACFVFPKNLDHPDQLREGWRARYDAAGYALLKAGADAIEAAFRRGRPVDHHALILEALPAPVRAVVEAGEADADLAGGVLLIASELDRVYRNTASRFIVDTLDEVPLRIYGRGWDRHRARGNPRHEYRDFDRVADGTTQFHTAYGILDVAPSTDMLHDRTWRAMRQGAGFLLCSSWQASEPLHDDFAALFFSGDPEALRSRVEDVQRDPEAHRARVRAFTEAYDARHRLSDFLDRVRGYAAQRGFTIP